MNTENRRERCGGCNYRGWVDDFSDDIPDDGEGSDWDFDGFWNKQFEDGEIFKTAAMFINEMHEKADAYEKTALKMFIDKDIHNAHNIMSNAEALRKAANIMDGNCCNG